MVNSTKRKTKSLPTKQPVGYKIPWIIIIWKGLALGGANYVVPLGIKPRTRCSLRRRANRYIVKPLLPPTVSIIRLRKSGYHCWQLKWSSLDVSPCLRNSLLVILLCLCVLLKYCYSVTECKLQEIRPDQLILLTTKFSCWVSGGWVFLGGRCYSRLSGRWSDRVNSVGWWICTCSSCWNGHTVLCKKQLWVQIRPATALINNPLPDSSSSSLCSGLFVELIGFRNKQLNGSNNVELQITVDLQWWWWWTDELPLSWWDPRQCSVT